MNKDNDNPLHVIPEGDKEKKKEGKNKTENAPAKDETKGAFTLPESYLLAHEMRALFDEDIVTHVQGPAEPEAE